MRNTTTSPEYFVGLYWSGTTTDIANGFDFREMTGSSRGAETTQGGGTLWHVNAGVGNAGSSNMVMTGTLDPSGGSTQHLRMRATS